MPPAHRMPLENDIRHWVHVHLHPRQPTKTLYPKITSHDSTEHHSSDFQRTVLWPLSLPHPHPSTGHEGTNRIATQPPSPPPEAKRKPQDHITLQCLPDPVRQRPWNPNPFQRGMRQPALPQNRRVPSHPCQLLQAQGTSHTARPGLWCTILYPKGLPPPTEIPATQTFPRSSHSHSHERQKPLPGTLRTHTQAEVTQR